MVKVWLRSCEVPAIRSNNRLVRALIRASFYPTLYLNRLVCASGWWNRWDWIDPHVAVGVLPTRRDLGKLSEAGVTAIVNLCLEYAGDESRLAALGITQFHLPTLDFHRPTADDIAGAVDFVNQHIAAGQKVYIHCKAGRGRSVAIAMGYLMTAHKITAAEAHLRIQKVRRQIDRDVPNNAYLLEFERRVLADA